ncbi:Site-specific recombinase XerD [Natrinema salifodinae]|uniref:Site-specific recombinase XerD n=1 Tax=Natrinema salifodinae TaxID=1202768 RepID=A0A1I0QSL3_9EURY|nr:Site-specific recombinase XerD [Natrinema salifodinae]
MSDLTETAVPTRRTPVEDALGRYFASLNAGGTIDTLRWVLEKGEQSFLTYLRERGVEYIDQIDVKCCRDWGMELRTRYIDDDLKASTAHNYFRYTRAFLSFCVRDQLLERNPAKTGAAEEFLPEDTGKRDRQFWRADDREALLTHVSRRVDRSFDDESIDTERAYRDRAIVTLLALAGVRGAEIFRDPNDERRNGCIWADVDLKSGELEVFGKSREYETVGLPTKARTALARYRKAVDPPTETWPVFPTGHYNSKRKALIDAYDATTVERWLEADGDRPNTAIVDDRLRKTEVPPPALSKNGGRRVMQRLCDEANLEIDGEYLKPHGGRRGLGHELYASGRSEYAQQALRHQSIETTHDAYSDIKSEDVANTIDEVMDATGEGQ